MTAAEAMSWVVVVYEVACKCLWVYFGYRLIRGVTS